MRNGVSDYSSNNPGSGQPVPNPLNPTAGRQNNQGLEGLSLAPDGKTLIAVLQSAAIQDLNSASINTTRRTTRIVTYDISDLDNPVVTGEYALQLPTYLNANGNVRVAAQSEILALSPTRFLILPRDGAGQGNADPLSRYRQVDIVDFADATNVLNTPDEAQIAPNGVLKDSITPATRPLAEHQQQC
ncbi:esterase-like activity of phytase family protein [Hankyongella ginsenosidimutans]|uniref:esterase-like activity of phytase family protein n=1 Tax=Hankyongella ginsenosidimutans TaxID=1763828 RepID=UPI001CA31693|nr:esterase-like activity of phytase family protein [Hankyongella ginsenosidimutans]